MTEVNLITVADFSAYALEIDLSQYTDATISGMISQASQRVSDYLMYSPVAEDIVDELKVAHITSDGDLVIYPNKLPIQSLSSISITKGATSVSLNLQAGNGVNKYNIDYTKRKILYPYGEITLQGVPLFTDFYALKGTHFYTKISYQGGWPLSELPATIKEATILFMREIMARRMNTTGANEISQGGITLKFGTGRSEAKSDLVLDAERLLGDYRRIG